jgi:hypothetical protein
MAMSPRVRSREIIKKICLLGDASSGKTQLIKRYVYSMFDDKYIATVGTKVTKKSMDFDRAAAGKKLERPHHAPGLGHPRPKAIRAPRNLQNRASDWRAGTRPLTRIISLGQRHAGPHNL